MAEPIRVGVIGVGTHGRRYARHVVRDVPGLDLIGVHCRSRDTRVTVAAEFDVTPFETVDALCDATEVVVIVTPPGSHPELVTRAVEAGAYVLVEKPVTRNAAEAAPLLALDARLGGRVMVAHTLRYDPVIATIRERVGEVAPVHLVRLSQRLGPNPAAWQRDPEIAGGGSILITGVHLFDTAAWILREPFTITSCVKDNVLNPVTEDFFLASGRSRSGVHLSLEVSKYTPYRSCLIEVVGENGQIFGDYWEHALCIAHAAERSPVEGIVATPTVCAALKDLEKWVRGEIENPIPLREGVRAVAAADQCYEAASA